MTNWKINSSYAHRKKLTKSIVNWLPKRTHLRNMCDLRYITHSRIYYFYHITGQPRFGDSGEAAWPPWCSTESCTQLWTGLPPNGWYHGLGDAKVVAGNGRTVSGQVLICCWDFPLWIDQNRIIQYGRYWDTKLRILFFVFWQNASY